ncbi:MAG: Mov34/MPN/PAD-1 family protein [Planctomycetales bacterium]|nr:Mov34/MPN/PAD-1 family protein [Planctomycetales bacterium]
MNDAEIQFGDIEERQYERRRRPDRDGHFAVVPYGHPNPDQLPIFIDLDVLQDIEVHAQEDTSVELGGVLLGGQFLDEQGQPFVMVVDSIRAEAYESSRGHFKFTKDTWTRISQRQSEFSDSFHMVGWYHTHPGWGVFLSNMDTFICENFFNRELDVAYVVDPQQLDRGWFYWKDLRAKELPRTDGFYATASRFRKQELTRRIARLQEGQNVTMNDDQDTRMIRQEVIHSIRPQLGGLGYGMLGSLGFQCLLMMLVVWQARPPAPPTTDSKDNTSLASAQLDARRHLFDSMLSKVRVDREGQVDVGQLVAEHEKLQDRAVQLERNRMLLERLEVENKDLAEKLATLEKSRADLISERDALEARVRKLSLATRAEISRDESVENAAADEQGGANRLRNVGLAVLALVVAGTATVPWILRRMAQSRPEIPLEEYSPSRRSGLSQNAPPPGDSVPGTTPPRSSPAEGSSRVEPGDDQGPDLGSDKNAEPAPSQRNEGE